MIEKRHINLMEESVEFADALCKSRRVQSVAELLAETAYVYLTKPARLRLAWDILKTILR